MIIGTICFVGGVIVGFTVASLCAIGAKADKEMGAK